VRVCVCVCLYAHACVCVCGGYSDDFFFYYYLVNHDDKKIEGPFGKIFSPKSRNSCLGNSGGSGSTRTFDSRLKWAQS